MNDILKAQGKSSAGVLTIWVDADSLPRDIRPLLIRRAIARRVYDATEIAVRFVAAVVPPDIPREYLSLVAPGEGAADSFIESAVTPSDIVVTRDIPLAERLVARSAYAINDRGDIFTRENVAERRSLRDAMAALRSSGLAPPSPKGSRRTQTETKRFADALERLIVLAVRSKK